MNRDMRLPFRRVLLKKHEAVSTRHQITPTFCDKYMVLLEVRTPQLLGEPMWTKFIRTSADVVSTAEVHCDRG